MIYDSKENYGRYLEEFQVGNVYRHWPGKTVTEREVRGSASKPDSGMVAIETRVHNQRDERVLTYRRSFLAPKKGA